ncbi:hypothetical protein [Georgenia sp. MJ170]|uniref:hypothetical protein n=1 Tax=Georgenia sunbinii TaxID=3117728 RepID=UPI002F264500
MKVQLAWPWTGPDGTKHKKGDVVDVPEHRGRELKRAGLARDPDKPAPAGTDEPANAPAPAADDAAGKESTGAAGQNAGHGRQKGAGK